MATVGFERPAVLLAVLIAVPVLWYLVLRPSRAGTATRRERLGLFGSRLLVVVLLVGAAAGPYTVAARETPGDPRVVLLTDESASTAVAPPVADRLAREIEARGVPVSSVVAGSGNASRLGDAVVANTEPNGSLVLVTDGRVTDGRSLAAAAEVADGVGATLSAVPLAADRAERYVTITGPSKTSLGIENEFSVGVGGTGGGSVPVTVTVDGATLAQRSVAVGESFTVTSRFDRVGPHRVTARIGADDVYAVNDAYYKTVHAVEPPRILYVSRRSDGFGSYLDSLYDVTRESAVPRDLSPYYAVVLHDMPAGSIGNVEALQQAVIDGNGLVVAGGPNAFEQGGYATAPFASMLPVRVGSGRGDRASIVLAVDVSGSASGGMRVQKALALDVLDQLGDQNEVGLVAFNRQAHPIAELAPLSSSRATLEDRIRRLQAGGGTRISVGIMAAADMLGEDGGTVIVVSDGFDEEGGLSVATAESLRNRNVRVMTVGVGQQVNAGLLREIATASGGSYYRADETNRLRIQFGDESRRFSGDSLTVVNPNHFITSGVELTASLGRSNRVAVKDGADYLVATGSGEPAVSSWRFGLGRVVAITAYAGDGGLGGLLARPDALLTTKAVNWAIGDPDRKATGVTEIGDTRVGDPAAVVHRGDRPTTDAVSFQQVGPGSYRGSTTPTTTGYHELLGATYAANYPHEYGGFGTDPGLSAAVSATGGRLFEPDDAAAIAAFARSSSTRVREVRRPWGWALLVAALLVFLVEVGVRRVRTYRPSGGEQRTHVIR